MAAASYDLDTAGGDLIPSSSSTKFYGQKVVLNGDSVAPHGDPPHGPAQPTISASQSTFIVEGKAVVQAGDSASCGHTASGSTTVIIG